VTLVNSVVVTHQAEEIARLQHDLKRLSDINAGLLAATAELLAANTDFMDALNRIDAIAYSGPFLIVYEGLRNKLRAHNAALAIARDAIAKTKGK